MRRVATWKMEGHTNVEIAGRLDCVVTTVERKLRRIIITPAMGLVWVLGLSLAFVTEAWTQNWFLAKFALVLALSGYHGWMVAYGKKLAQGERPVSGRALRMMNEIPGIAVVLIVVLVVVRPF